MNLKNFNIRDFSLSLDTTDKLGSIFYDSDDDRDTWVEIAYDSCEPDTIIVTIVYKAEAVKRTYFDLGNRHSLSDVEHWINREVIDLV